MCMSPNRTKYESLRFDEQKKYTFQELEVLSEELEGKRIGHTTFHRHMTKHFLPAVLKTLDDEDTRKRMVERKIGETLDIIEELRQNIRILRDILKNTITEGEDLSGAKIKAIRACLSEIRLTTETLSDLTKELRISPQEGKTQKEEFLRLVEKLSPEQARSILEVMEDEL